MVLKFSWKLCGFPHFLVTAKIRDIKIVVGISEKGSNFLHDAPP
jgi:hypothetical protein